nr:MBL fold metallo-hydrolase [Parvularcula mediterranea]
MTTLLVDCAPELRLQMIENGIPHVDAVAITHDHADQTHGLDDLRAIAINQMARVPVYVSDKTSPVLKQRFAYLFEQIPGSSYPPIVDTLEMPEEGATAEIDGPTGPIPMTPFLQTHGRVMSHGFRFGPLAYSSDLDGLVDESWPMLESLDCWIIDALQMKPHGSHLHLAKALEYLEQVRAKRGVLTNLHVTMDYKTVQDQVPENVTVAHDGLVVEVVA